jgi:cytochrome b
MVCDLCSCIVDDADAGRAKGGFMMRRLLVGDPDRAARAVTDAKDVSRSVWVWDLPTRLFHWLLVGAVLVALITELIAPAWWLSWHVAAGYTIAALLLFRLVWGLFGSGYSRLASFSYRPRQVVDYLRQLLKLRPPHYIGHNPAGAAMIFALFAVLTGLVVTGFIVQGGQEKQGPFAGVAGFAFGNNVRGIHNFLAYLLMAMVAAHVAGVLADGRLHKSSIIRAMITGWKRVPAHLSVQASRPPRILAAVVVLAALFVPAVGALILLARMPPLGVPAMIPDQVWAKECGACHYAFHPSLLPRASWAALMADLHDHFGEDASLPPAAAAEVAAFLQAYAAEGWDTKAARLLSNVAPTDPLRITAAPFWIRRHRRIAPAIFAAPTVKAKSNCVACHRDADSGRFDAQAIVLPDPAPSGASP